MSKLTLIILAFLSSNAIFVASWETCNADRQCTDGCCVNSICYTKNNWRCTSYKHSCTKNYDCNSGCCKNNECQAWKSECDTGKSCYWNWECDSKCYCQVGKCQETYEPCSSTTITATPYTSDNCYYSSCDYGKCCVNGKCQYCHQPTTYPWRRTTWWKRTTYPWWKPTTHPWWQRTTHPWWQRTTHPWWKRTTYPWWRTTYPWWKRTTTRGKSFLFSHSLC